uniref:C2H2-type domain-containing protein n=1 Tax=Cyprinus carpio TaxID=7962 RepID=A0A8C2DS67_CYPCA
MVFIKEESEDVRIEETFRVKQEDTEEQTDLMALKEEKEVLNEIGEEDQHEDLQKTGTRSYFACYSQQGNFKVQMRIHTGKKPFTCEQCGKSFTLKIGLKRHMKIHTGEKPYMCPQCGKSFCQSGNLKVHMGIHTGKRYIICQQCGKSFTRKANHDRHMRIHTGEKLYTCQYCGESFAQRENLTVHMRVHTRENSYLCHQCGKRFRQRRNLTVHMRTHTGKKPFTCEQLICAALGRLRWSLWKLDIASVFFNVNAFMELRSNANLPCLVNLAQDLIRVSRIPRMCEISTQNTPWII